MSYSRDLQDAQQQASTYKTNTTEDQIAQLLDHSRQVKALRESLLVQLAEEIGSQYVLLPDQTAQEIGADKIRFAIALAEKDRRHHDTKLAALNNIDTMFGTSPTVTALTQKIRSLLP